MATENFLLLGRAARYLARNSNERAHRLRALTAWVDEEAHAVGLKLINEVLNLIKPSQGRNSMLPYTGLPFVRNASFFNRPEQLKQLSEVLNPEKERPPGLVHAALLGAGGNGKTQIAIEYTHRVAKVYDAILWCAADSTLTLSESFASHVRALGVLQENAVANEEAVRSSLKRWLVHVSRSGRCASKILVDNT